MIRSTTPLCFVLWFACAGCPTSVAEDAGGGKDAATDGGNGDCAFESDLGPGLTGAPTASDTTIVAGDPLTITLPIVNTVQAGANLVNRATNESGGGGFMDATGDGNLEITVDTQFAQPRDYVVILDLLPAGAAPGTFVVVGFPEGAGDDYVRIDVEDNVFGTEIVLNNCGQLVITVEPPN